MHNNKKGLSTIVATLLIILLTLVAVGIIWVVVRNVIQGGSEQVDIDAKCLQANVVATKVVNDSIIGEMNKYNVTLSRQSGGDVIGGVKLVFTDDAETASFVFPVAENIVSPSTITRQATVNLTLVPNPGKVNVVAYFEDASGNEQLCSANQNVFDF